MGARDRLLLGGGGRRLCRLDAIRTEAPDRHRRRRTPADGRIWWAFALLCALVAADNLLWRVAGWSAAYTFVAVTGDIRRDLFGHLSGHSPNYFAERLPGALASRITATANAAFTTENTGSWNVLPPCVAVVCSIVLIGSVNLTMALALVGAAAELGGLVFHLARRGTPLHRSFAAKAAAVDGELVDVIGNMGVVRAFGATFRERRRIGATIGVEMGARSASLIYLERLRLIHAVITTILIAGLVAWGLLLWQDGHATVGDLVLITALSFGILHCTRDLAVALVDLTQHVARLEEAIGALLSEHELPDRPGARLLLAGAGEVTFEQVGFAYPGRAAVLREFGLVIEPGQRVGLVGPSGAGKSTVLNLIPRFYDITAGELTVDDQDVRGVALSSLRRRIALVTQEIRLFDDTIAANIAYAKAGASQAEIEAAARAAAATSSSWPCPRATTPRSARRACGCRAASASASRSPGPS